VRADPVPWAGARELSLSDYWIRALVVLGTGALIAGMVFLYLFLQAELTFARREVARATLSAERLQREVLYYEHQAEVAFSRRQLAERARQLGMGPFNDEQVTELKLENNGSPPGG